MELDSTYGDLPLKDYVKSILKKNIELCKELKDVKRALNEVQLSNQKLEKRVNVLETTLLGRGPINTPTETDPYEYAKKMTKRAVKAREFNSNVIIPPELMRIARSITKSSCSHKNFAQKMLKHLYLGKEEELLNKNVRGKKGKERVPKEKIDTIKSIMHKLFPETMKGPTGDMEWELSIRSIDELLRRPYRTRQPKRRNLLDALDNQGII